MTLDARSQELFGRYEALRVYAVIARLSKPEFTTGNIVSLSDSASVSKELGRLSRLGLVRPVSRRGEYVRLDSPFWEWIDTIAAEWSDSR